MELKNNDWFVVSTGVAPLYKSASFNSNYITEMVFGDSCEILKIKKSWLFVRCNDGYQGWVKNFYGFVSAVKNNPSHLLRTLKIKDFQSKISIWCKIK